MISEIASQSDTWNHMPITCGVLLPKIEIYVMLVPEFSKRSTLPSQTIF